MSELQIKSFLSGILSIAILISSKTLAMPVLSANDGATSTKVLTIFRDHENPSMIYFLPDTGQVGLTPEGKPNLFLYISKSETGPSKEGVFTATVKTGLSPSVKLELDNLLFSKKYKSAAVVPIYDSFIKGSLENKVLFKAIDLPPHAGVAETEVAINIVFTDLGARATRAALLNGNTGATTFSLCFKVDGITPMMSADVAINYRQAYEYMASEFSQKIYFWSLNAKQVVEKLHRDGAIKIVITGGDAKLEDYLSRITDQLLKRYATETLANTPEEQTNKGSWTFNRTFRETLQTERLHLERRDYIKRDYCVAIPFNGVSKFAKELIVEE